jgi:hypothetical protein
VTVFGEESMVLRLLSELPPHVRDLVGALVALGEITLIFTREGDCVDCADLDPYRSCYEE